MKLITFLGEVQKKKSQSYKVLIGVMTITVQCAIYAIFVWLLDDVLHVLDVLDSDRHHLLQKRQRGKKVDRIF